MDILSTPFPRHSNNSWREGDIMRILDDVSRMNLEGSSIPPRRHSVPDDFVGLLTPPPLNRRMPYFVVTPPQTQRSVEQLPVLKTRGSEEGHDEEIDCSMEGGLSRKRLRGTANRQLAPMLPDSKYFSTTSSSLNNNVYERHIPMYSPIGGVSKLNMDFISKLHEASSPSSSSVAMAPSSSVVPSRDFLEEMSASTILIANSFPTLEDEDDDHETTDTKRIRRDGNGATGTTRVLKMRRRCKDDFELWDAL